MIKLNDSNIQVGQIKQYLKEFNLPKCPVGIEKREANKHYINSKSMIHLYQSYKVKEGETEVTKYKDTEIQQYVFNKKYQNLTTTLRISNMLYDRDTHRYLGRYLRFLRDYKKIDLMPLYNCFDQEALEESFNITWVDDTGKTTKEVSFNTLKTNYMYYQIPVKTTNYSLFLDTSLNIEGCLHIINLPDIGSNLELLKKLHKETHFNQVIYKKRCFDLNIDNWETDLKNFIKAYSENLYLVLQIPKTYLGYITLIEKDLSTITPNGFGYIVDGKYLYAGNWFNSKLNTYLNNQNYLLSDKIIQYITGNAITNISEDYDISKYQKLLIMNKQIPNDHIGYWDEKDLVYLKTYINKNNIQLNNFDVLGYVDSDVEKSFTKVEEGGLI